MTSERSSLMECTSKAEPLSHNLKAPKIYQYSSITQLKMVLSQMHLSSK